MPGTLYLRSLTLLVAPLVFCSIIIGISNLREAGHSARQVTGWTLGLYSVTTLLAISESLAMTYMLYPAWNAHVHADLTRVSPSMTRFDSSQLITITYLRHPEYFNSTTAVMVRVRFSVDRQAKDFASLAPETNVTRLFFWYPRAITFALVIGRS